MTSGYAKREARNAARKKWLEELAVGTEVAYLADRGYYGGGTPMFAKVVRFTTTLIVLENGERFRRGDGTRMGTHFNELMKPGDVRILRAAYDQMARGLKTRIDSLFHEATKPDGHGRPRKYDPAELAMKIRDYADGMVDKLLAAQKALAVAEHEEEEAN